MQEEASRPPGQLIGYWAGEYDPGWPDVRRFVVAAPNKRERTRVVRYLRAGAGWRAYRGFSLCRLCGCQNGSSELTDGVWVWPEGLAHYVRRHDVRLPDVFIRYVLDHRRPSKHAVPPGDLDDSWWRSVSTVTSTARA